MAIKKTHEQFLLEIEQRNILFPTEQIKVKTGEFYSGIDTKLTFECLNGHSEFITSPRHILIKKSGCPVCGSKRTATKNTNSHNSFIEKLNERNKRFSTVLLLDGESYNGVHKKLKFKCNNPLHEYWEATPASILQGHGCPTCGNMISKDTHQHTHDQFVELLNIRNQEHPLKQVFLSPDQQYVQQNKKLNFTCNKSHNWNTLPGDVIHRKIGCPYCATSKNFSFMAVDWLTSVEQSENITILHRGNSPKEFSIPGTHYTVDGYCKETNTVYEFHGNYWHGNPRLFSGDDLNDRVGKTYGELYKETIKKEETIKSLGYNLVTMWEDEYDNKKLLSKLSKSLLARIKHMDIHVVIIPISAPYDKYHYVHQLNTSLDNGTQTIFLFEDELVQSQLILDKLNHYSQTNTAPLLHARKCTIKRVNNTEKRDLLDKYHTQGNDNAQIAYGAFYDDKLVSVMTFTVPRVALGQKNKNGDYGDVWELSRFCTDTSYRIPGIASRLLKHFQRNHNWSEIYSFADRRWSVGRMYEKLGFTLTATNPPAYFYVVDGVRKHRWNYRKDILKNTLPNYDSTLTEYQNMVNHGYWRVWDCGTLKFSIRNT